MFQLVRRARGRILRNRLLAELANAASVTLLFAIILLSIGTGTLPWWWILAVAPAAAAVALVRAARRMPSAYATAQQLDRRLGYADSISTALHFDRHPETASPEVRRCQFRDAERICSSADVRKAFPYSLPRSVYPMAALFLVVSGLFALRYAATGTLNLKAPLASLLLRDAPEAEHVEEASNRQGKPEPDAAKTPGDFDGPLDAKGPRQGATQRAGSEAAKEGSPSNAGQASAAAKAAQQEEGETIEQLGAADAGQNASQSQQAEQRSAESARGEPNHGDQAAGADAASSSQQSSILGRMKDAMQNLLSRVKPQGAQQPSSARGQQGRQSGQAPAQQTAAAQGQPGDGGRSGDGGKSKEGQADRSADSSGGQGKAQGEGQAQSGSKEPGSGAGAEDGSKEAKAAEQLAAMGKISEILGKRAANISGEATVEVQSSEQQLRTPYAQRKATPGQGGAEIARDEVPVALQAYVAQYFEQVRKKQKK